MWLSVSSLGPSLSEQAQTNLEQRSASALAVESYRIAAAGLIPNNRKLPLLVYREVLDAKSRRRGCEQVFEALFRSNGWGGCWIDGIYDYHHYHSTAHEVLGIAHGRAKVQFGGSSGMVLDLALGDVVILPAGTGHCRLESRSLSVVGAYPEGQDFDVCRATAKDLEKAAENIPWVPLPARDPVYGANGPLLEAWIE